jgi:hypothetical protein
MICLLNLIFSSGLDLNVESQTWGFLAEIRKNPYAPRQARICATHAVPAAEHVSPLCPSNLVRIGLANTVILFLMIVLDSHQTFIPVGDAERSVCRRRQPFASHL